jgi:dTDP-4-dehydrorhamnose reductase
VGWNVYRVAGQSGHTVVGTYHQCAVPGLLRLSLADSASLATLMNAETPDAVIYCAAWSWVDGCESDRVRAFRENSDLPQKVARIVQGMGAQFAYYSTSYVFGGEAGPYCEDDEPKPLSVYAESKLSGEKAVLETTGGNALIIRTMGVYGEERQRKNFVYQVVQNLRANRPMKVPNDQFGNATYAPDIAVATLLLLQDRVKGVWNVAGPDPNLNRAEFARRIAHAYGLNSDLLDPVPTSVLNQQARRPLRAGLRIDKIKSRYPWNPTDWQPIP